MKALKIVGNVFGILFAVIFSIVLLVVLLASPVFTAASDIIKPKTIQTIITNIDYGKILADSGLDTESVTAELGLPTQAISDIMKSDVVGNVVGLYTQEFEAALAGDMEANYFTADAIKQEVDKNIDQLTNIIFSNIPQEEIPVETPVEELKEQIKTEIGEYIDTNAESIVSSLPDVKQIVAESVDDQTLEVVRYVQSGTFTTSTWITISILSVLIFLFRFPRFKGFMWLGVVYFLGAGLIYVLGFILNGTLLNTILESIPGMDAVIIPTIDAVCASIFKVAIILTVLSVVFIAAFVVGRVYLTKRKTALASTAPALEADGCPAETLLSFPEENELAAETVAESTEENAE